MRKIKGSKGEGLPYNYLEMLRFLYSIASLLGILIALVILGLLGYIDFGIFFSIPLDVLLGI